MIDSKKMIKNAYKALEEKMAKDIVVIDISKISTISDYFIIASGTSLPHIQSLVYEVVDELAKDGYEDKAVEGDRSSSWVLLDYLDIIVHIFTEEDREFYNLERIWRDGTLVSKEDILGDNE